MAKCVVEERGKGLESRERGNLKTGRCTRNKSIDKRRVSQAAKIIVFSHNFVATVMEYGFATAHSGDRFLE